MLLEGRSLGTGLFGLVAWRDLDERRCRNRGGGEGRGGHEQKMRQDN